MLHWVYGTLRLRLWDPEIEVMGPWLWDPGYGTLDTLVMGPWIPWLWDPGHGYPMGWALAIPGGSHPGIPLHHPGYTPSLPTHVAVHGGEAKRALLNAMAFLSKRRLVDHRFTVMPTLLSECNGERTLLVPGHARMCLVS